MQQVNGRFLKVAGALGAVLASSGDCQDPVPHYQDFTREVDRLELTMFTRSNVTLALTLIVWPAAGAAQTVTGKMTVQRSIKLSTIDTSTSRCSTQSTCRRVARRTST